MEYSVHTNPSLTKTNTLEITIPELNNVTVECEDSDEDFGFYGVVIDEIQKLINAGEHVPTPKEAPAPCAALGIMAQLKVMLWNLLLDTPERKQTIKDIWSLDDEDFNEVFNLRSTKPTADDLEAYINTIGCDVKLTLVTDNFLNVNQEEIPW